MLFPVIPRYAGSTGTSYKFPSTDFVGPPSALNADSNTNKGAGQRQSIWAGAFTNGQNFKIVLDSTVAASMAGQNVRVKVHYLNNSPNAFITVTAFGNTLGVIDVGDTGDWQEVTYNISSATIDVDEDGAHAAMKTSGGTVLYHMIEVYKQ
jgi:hypothetical protein